MKKAKLSLLVVISGITLALSFQNCGKKLAAYSEGSPAKGLQCPMYMPPICEADEEITIAPDDCGGHPVCTPMTVVSSCPIYQRPICDADEVLVIVTDPNKCSRPMCVVKSAPVMCPIYQRPLCEPGEVLVSVSDENGCKRPVCSSK